MSTPGAPSPTASSTRTRVLFLAWGDSIHARRRIGIFTADPSFEVGVISTFAYEFKNAKNYYLSKAMPPQEPRHDLVSRMKRWLNRNRALPLYWLMKPFDRTTTLLEHSVLLNDILMVRRYAREFKPDLVFAQTLLYPCYLALLLPRRIPLMITFWNGDVTWWAQHDGVERAFKKKLVERASRRAAAITVNSAAARDACLSYGADADKIQLIRYPGVDLQLFNPSVAQENARQALRITARNVVLCPRGLGGYLNSDVIIEAANLVIAQAPDTLFLFISGVGSEELWEEHLQRASALGIAGNLRRDGKVDWKTMPLYYRAANVMVSPSSNDSLPNCMLEAMACGVPVVMGDIPQIKEWVTHNENGLLVPPRDAQTLADAVLAVLKVKVLVEKFTEMNLRLIENEVDSRAVAGRIKQLVKTVGMQR
jgi:glycosyltransferase involved in cell wall biosynthesis